MPIRRVLNPLVLSMLLLSSPLLAQPHRPKPPASRFQDLIAAFWARVVGIPEKSGSSLDPDGLTNSSTPNDSTDIGSNLDPNGKT